ncbi:D-2-hydroxyacid dehydrogenase [Tuberibacillus sp. Marseille-P3662]|uniref:D-2-hydroxyacid dehydrogenase n=1 Tax=Tuberibacillus sp. Marseille-P3662 TaxID=1965358 RepID=UPI000A1CD4C5|nr:D-2-hydroxyacid dehydrogenase [Tuberibacillus sp. Marseille-P3662]
MNVVTSAKIRRDLRAELHQEFPRINFSFHTSMNEAKHDLQQADILITYGEDLDAEIINGAERLKWIMVISAGVEKMPLETILNQNITVTNARGIHKIPMAEYTLGVLLKTIKNMDTWYDNQQAHVWDRSVTMSELAGKTMTIIGPGAIGGEVARLAKAFRMNTLGINRTGKSANHIDEMYKMQQMIKPLQAADFVVSILPYTSETEQLITKTQFEGMKSSAIFINIGRGQTVRQADLLEALNEGDIAHAVLDVFEEEPLDAEHPFWAMDQVTITPHFSAITSQYQPRAIDIFKRNLRKYINGERDFVNWVDMNRGY